MYIYIYNHAPLSVIVRVAALKESSLLCVDRLLFCDLKYIDAYVMYIYWSSFGYCSGVVFLGIDRLFLDHLT